MAFFKITHNPKHRFATLHNYGCNFRCPICSYKLRSGADGRPGFAYPKPERFLGMDEIKAALLKVKPEKVYFMGGEPGLATELPEVLEFVKQSLGVPAFLGHTNGSRLPMANLAGANVGLKAWDPQVHLQYTGQPKDVIFDNFVRSVEAGLEMRANIVYIPGLIDLDQVEAVAAWLAGVDPELPFHIMGYIPVPGQPYSRPTAAQMAAAVACSQKHLRKVKCSHLDSEQALGLAKTDDRFQVEQIA
jgi:pyruvate formate lyase activating enzyme